MPGRSASGSLNAYRPYNILIPQYFIKGDMVLVLKQLKFGRLSEFGAQIFILATITSSLSVHELLKQQSGYFTGTYRFVSVRMEAAVLIHYLYYVKK